MGLEVQENNRPFFSIVISCYNSKKTLGRLLESLCNQELEYDDLEIIISDDCSTEPYDDIINQYIDKLNIKLTKTEYNCCPGNTREAGARLATGRWLSFSDHDDEFVPNGLSELKKSILATDEKYYIITSFFNTDKAHNFTKEYLASNSQGWTHGKFYNLDNLWRKYNIHYKKDLKSHEDVYLTTTILCLIDKIHNDGDNAGTYFDNLFTYIWYYNPDSLSHQKYQQDRDFLETHFIDYMNATGEVYLDNYYNNIITFEKAKKYLLDTIILAYFYMESFTFQNPSNPLKDNVLYITNFINRIKKEFDLTNRSIWMYAAEGKAAMFDQGYESSKIGTGGIIPHLTYAQWLYVMSPDDSLLSPIFSPYYYNKGDKEQ